MTLSEPFPWVLWLSSMSTRDFCNIRITLLCTSVSSVRLVFAGCTRVMRRNSFLVFVSVEADRSPRFHSHLGGSHSSNHFCVIAYLRSQFLSCTWSSHKSPNAFVIQPLYLLIRCFFHYDFFLYHYDACHSGIITRLFSNDVNREPSIDFSFEAQSKNGPARQRSLVVTILALFRIDCRRLSA
jgi:hypothetical protein